MNSVIDFESKFIFDVHELIYYLKPSENLDVQIQILLSIFTSSKTALFLFLFSE